MGIKISAEIDNNQTEAILILINVVGHGHRVSFNGCEILTYIYVYKDAYICMDRIHVNYDTHTHNFSSFQFISLALFQIHEKVYVQDHFFCQPYSLCPSY